MRLSLGFAILSLTLVAPGSFGESRVNLQDVKIDGELQKEGLSLWQSAPFDIVLCAERLPDGNGLEMLKTLIQQRPETISILMTARQDALLKQEAMKVGIQGYLEKPFDLKQLEEAMGVPPLSTVNRF